MINPGLITPVRFVIASIMLTSTLSITIANADMPNADRHLNEIPSLVVKYGDLDISTDVGARRLYRRIVAAAEQVCPASSAQNLQNIAAARTCRAEAVARAVQVVNSQQLAVIHQQSIQHS